MKNDVRLQKYIVQQKLKSNIGNTKHLNGVGKKQFIFN